VASASDRAGRDRGGAYGPVMGQTGRQVVVLNGPAGVGKTTVGRRLAATARNGVCVHGDDLKRFVVAREPGSVEQGLTYVGGAALADVFLEAGYDLVVFEFVFERRMDVERFLGRLRSDAAVALLTLWAPLETVLARERGRPDRAPLGDRAAACWNAMATALPELGATVDARGSVEEVLAEALRQVAAGSRCDRSVSADVGRRAASVEGLRRDVRPAGGTDAPARGL
jgi:chloramphenicol 3-O-phosphotransferase